jgi:hypothetical protein
VAAPLRQGRGGRVVAEIAWKTVGAVLGSRGAY